MPEQAVMQRLGSSPAAEELRKAVRAALTDLFGNFLHRLPASLIETARSAQSVTEQRACQELARSVPSTRQRWLDIFVLAVDSHLIGHMAERKTSAGSAAEDSIALANVELRAESLHQNLISQLDARLDHVRRSLYVPVFIKALAPAGLCRALQDTADALDCSGAQRRMLFEKFDQIVVTELQSLYGSLLDALTDIDRRAAELAVEPPPEPVPVAESPPAAARSSAPAQPAKPVLKPVPKSAPKPAGKPVEERPQRRPEAMPPPAAAPAAAPKPKVDSKTVSMLQAFATTAADGVYNDGSLASDLLALDANKPVAGFGEEQRMVPLQRISLAGNFLNDAIADPFVSDELGPQHESVRFPLVKSALTDATLFTALTHPLRSLVNELMLKSATSRISGTAEARRMAEVLQQVLVQFDLAPDFVREAMLTAQPIDEAQIHRFFEMQKQQAQQRKEAVIAEAKRLVVRELELRTFGRTVPATALKFLNTCWGPLLVKWLLKHGAAHYQWKAGLDLMEKMLDELEVSDRVMPPPPEWQELMRVMGKELDAGGLPAERLTEAMTLLEGAWQEGSERSMM